MCLFLIYMYNILMFLALLIKYDWKSPKVFKKIDIPQGVDGNFKAKCKHCTAIISALTKTSSNLLRHLFSFCLNSDTLQSVTYMVTVSVHYLI